MYLNLIFQIFIQCFSGWYFPAFGLNTETYRVNLRIESKWGKIWTRKTLNTDTFYAAFVNSLSFLLSVVLICFCFDLNYSLICFGFIPSLDELSCNLSIISINKWILVEYLEPS